MNSSKLIINFIYLLCKCQRVWERVCVSDRERETEQSVCMSDRERVRERPTVCGWARERVCVWARKRESEGTLFIIENNPERRPFITTISKSNFLKRIARRSRSVNFEMWAIQTYLCYVILRRVRGKYRFSFLSVRYCVVMLIVFRSRKQVAKILCSWQFFLQSIETNKNRKTMRGIRYVAKNLQPFSNSHL